MLANAFASRLFNIHDDDTATDRQKLQARNKQKALETSISICPIVATAGAPEGKDQLPRMKDMRSIAVSIASRTLNSLEYASQTLFQRHAELHVAYNAVCLISGFDLRI